MDANATANLAAVTSAVTGAFANVSMNTYYMIGIYGGSVVLFLLIFFMLYASTSTERELVKTIAQWLNAIMLLLGLCDVLLLGIYLKGGEPVTYDTFFGPLRPVVRCDTTRGGRGGRA
jgi:hypothetical protein